MLNLLILLTSLLSFICAAAQEAGEGQLQLAKRQDFNITLGNDGGSINGTIPIQCIAGCAIPFVNFAGCVVENDNDTCALACSARNFTNFEQCLNCIVINGDPPRDAQAMLMSGETEFADGFTPTTFQTNMVGKCNSSGHSVTPISIVTSATTTGPFATTWTGATYHPPVWTGLTEFTNFTSTNAVSGSASSSMASASASQSASMSASMSVAASSSAASSAAASATSKAAASRVEAAGLGNGVLGGVLGMLALWFA